VRDVNPAAPKRRSRRTPLRVAFVAAVCAAAGAAPVGGSNAASAPACGAPLSATTDFSATAACPDLAVGRLTATVVDSGRRLALTTQVVNQGTADSPQTTVRAVAGADVLATQVLPALGVKASERVSLTPLIPTDLRGTGRLVTLTVDPADQVPELDEDNNVARSKAFFPLLPDLTIGDVTTKLDSSGRAITVGATITNVGGAADELQTTIQASARNKTATAPVAPLQVGESTSVVTTLRLPDRLVGLVQVAVAVDPNDLVAEQNEDNNSDSPKPISIAPDLAIASIDHTREGRIVHLQMTIQNGGNTPSPETTAHASAPGWQGATAHVAAVAPRSTTTVAIALRVPHSALGRTVPIKLSVDPVAGDPPDNNHGSTNVRILAPPQPPTTYPDLTVSAPHLRVENGMLHVHALVANIGEAGATGVRLVLSAEGWPDRRRTLSSLGAAHSATVDFRYRVPTRARGRTAKFTLVAEPAQGERSLANNRASATVRLPVGPTPTPPPLPPNGPPWKLIGSLAGVLLGVSIGLTLAIRGRRLRVRARWETEADGERPEVCTVPQSHVLRIDGKPKPALRKIEKLELRAAANGDDEERRKSIEGSIVEYLNRALWARRLRRGRRLEALTESAGERLAAEIEQWLAGDERRDVTVSAHVTGGKVECEFKRSECVREGDSCRWEERQSWKRELEHPFDEPVSTVRVPLQPRGERVRQLSADCRALVERVDSPRRTRIPERAALRGT
jgi:CARDB protein